MRRLKTAALPFSVLLGIGLAVAIPLMLGIFTDVASTGRNSVIAILVAVGIAAVASTLVIILYWIATRWTRRLSRDIAARIAFATVEKALVLYGAPIESSGITIVDGDLYVRPDCGSLDQVTPGHRFLVVNNADGEIWGLLEAHQISEGSCLCQVSDRINSEFWESLRRRARTEPSLPLGVTVKREVPDEDEFNSWLRTLLDFWRS